MVRCGLTMSPLLLGYFLLLSLTEGSKAFTCSPGPLTATCDAGKVILINRVQLGSYRGAFNGSHCKYQIGDSIEFDDSNSKDVWKDCNLQRTCSVPFIVSGNYYLEMDFECGELNILIPKTSPTVDSVRYSEPCQVFGNASSPTTDEVGQGPTLYKSNIDMLDICDTGSGTRLVTKHGYIHSPCYPNLSTWTASTYVYCQCNGTFKPSVKAEPLTISVFHAFQETDSLEIRWHRISNPPEAFKSTSPNFKTEQRTIGSFHLVFYSDYQGSDWDRGFWLGFKANTPLEFSCSNTVDFTPPTCQPPPSTTTSTATTSTTSTTTTHAHYSTPTSSSGRLLPGVTTTLPGTATTSSLSPTHATSKEVDGSQLSEQDVIIPVTVGLAVPLVIVSAVLTSLVIILWRNGLIARLCKYHSGENTDNGAQNNANADTPSRPLYENVRMDNENASGSNYVNHAFIGDQNPAVNLSDIGNSSNVIVPDIAANSTANQTQRMPTYENVVPNCRSPGARVFGTGSHSQEAASADGDGFPYAEIGGTGASSMPGALGAEAESPYAKLDPVERSEYLDLRHIGFTQAQPK